MRTLIVLLVAAVLLCQANAFIDEMLRENVNDQPIDERECRDHFSSNICGNVIKLSHCNRRTGRMAKFAKKNCKSFCGLC
ncbi:protein Class8-like [Nematostella vectensis]|uniref:protein Class8-like n=1 Tax=Nematostella vectensis TaxID=45351 RepID=UPI00138FB86F|nr:protein Class8-like [Nematostella vectensis]